MEKEDYIIFDSGIVLPKKTFYQYMMDNNKDKLDSIAMTYLGDRKITYGEFDEKIIEVGKAFSGIGISKNDRVGMLMPTFPEYEFMAYGLNKIGAVSDNIDPTVSSELLEHFLGKEKIKTLVTFSLGYEQAIQPIADKIKYEYGINDVVLLDLYDTSDSLKFSLRTVLKLQRISNNIFKSKKSALNVIPYSDFLKSGRCQKDITEDYEPNRLAAICHSSGTTALPKMMPSTNENMIYLVEQHKKLLESHGVDFSDIKTFFHVLPGFAQFGFSNSMNLGFSLGFNMIEIPKISIETFGLTVLKCKADCVYGLPSWWLALINDPNLQSADLSFLKIAVAGGDKLEKEEIEKINTFLHNHGAKCELIIGYGMSEFCGSCSINVPGKEITGGLGKPFVGTDFKIINRETGKELERGDEGALCVRKESMPEEEIDGLRIYESILIDGKKYLITGDLGMVMENEEVMMLGREGGLFSRYDGYNVNPIKIEQALMTSHSIKNCMATYFIDEEKHGKMPIAYIILNDDVDLSSFKQELLHILKTKFIGAKMNLRDIPTKIVIRDNLPLTSASKRDYKKLREEGVNGIVIDVILEESNLGIKIKDVILPKLELEKRKRLVITDK